jgi:bisphosphoglycerate-dependent phosphoglycerate mutase
MEPTLIEHHRSELLDLYPGSQIKVAPEQREMVAEITGESAIAIVDRVHPYFHREITETYRVLRATLP